MLLSLVSSFFVAVSAQENFSPLALKIFFNEWESPPQMMPGDLPLGIETDRPVHYKLESADRVISTGLLMQGMNIISFSTEGFFEKSGSHVLELSIRHKEKTYRLDLGLDVSIKKEKEDAGATTDPAPLTFRTRLSLYSEGQLLSEEIQIHTLNWDHLKRMPAIPSIPKYSAHPWENLGDNSISIPMLIMGIIRYAVQKKSEAKKRELAAQARRKMELNWTLDEESGDGKRLSVQVSVKLRILGKTDRIS